MEIPFLSEELLFKHAFSSKRLNIKVDTCNNRNIPSSFVGSGDNWLLINLSVLDGGCCKTFFLGHDKHKNSFIWAEQVLCFGTIDWTTVIHYLEPRNFHEPLFRWLLYLKKILMPSGVARKKNWWVENIWWFQGNNTIHIKILLYFQQKAQLRNPKFEYLGGMAPSPPWLRLCSCLSNFCATWHYQYPILFFYHFFTFFIFISIFEFLAHSSYIIHYHLAFYINACADTMSQNMLCFFSSNKRSSLSFYHTGWL